MPDAFTILVIVVSIVLLIGAAMILGGIQMLHGHRRVLLFGSVGWLLLSALWQVGMLVRLRQFEPTLIVTGSVRVDRASAERRVRASTSRHALDDGTLTPAGRTVWPPRTAVAAIRTTMAASSTTTSRTALACRSTGSSARRAGRISSPSFLDIPSRTQRGRARASALLVRMTGPPPEIKPGSARALPQVDRSARPHGARADQRHRPAPEMSCARR